MRDLDVIGVDPAAALLEVAGRKWGADRVRWLHGDATSLPPLAVGMVTMTGNVAQVFLTDEEWATTLRAARRALRRGGRLVFEVRDPSRPAWQAWNREQSLATVHVPEVGNVDHWCRSRT
jgi:SAM-dependent methyltransferase